VYIQDRVRAVHEVGWVGVLYSSFMHRSIPTEGTQYNTFIGRSGNGKIH
jgi:hypothetical protein